jgi:cytochrome P450
VYNYPPGYSWIGSYLRGVKVVSSPIEAMQESLRRFGNSYTVFAGTSRRMIITQDLAFIEHVLKKNHKNYHKSEMVTRKLGRFIGNGLLSSNGPYWLRQRRLIQPGFHLQKVQALYGIMSKTIEEFLVRFPPGESVDIYPQMNKLAFEIVINTLFDVDIPAEARQELAKFISETQEFVIRDIRQPYKSWWYTLSGEVKANMKKAMRARQILRGIVQERKSSAAAFNDLLDMLVNARYEDSGEGMTEEQILDEILILFIAGHETTGNALTWTLYLLAQNPHVLEEVRSVATNYSVMETVSSELLNAVINESMRLYPPAWIADRVALDDDSVNGISFPAGTIIGLFYYGLHRSTQYWKDPLRFDPGRFTRTDDDDKEKHKAFFPFGGGPRLCIGNNFAIGEMTLFLQSFVKNFDISPTSVLPVMKPMVTLRPEGVVLKVRRR